MIHLRNLIGICILMILSYSCSNEQQKKIVNIGYIGPLTGPAKVLGVWPAKALELAVYEYNFTKDDDMPLVNLFIEDDAWDNKKALPLYNNLQNNSQIDIVFISNTGGTVAIEDKAFEDEVLVINPLNNDAMLNRMNENVFRIAKKTEEISEVLANRLIELGHKKVLCFHFQNDFMTRCANGIEKSLKDADIEITKVDYKKGVTTFTNIINEKDAIEADAIVFCGYTESGYIMKELREMGTKAPFYAINNTIPTPQFYKNAGTDAIGTEFAFFTAQDGNYILVQSFLKRFEQKFGERPHTVWGAMQAYDAMNIVLNAIKKTQEAPIEENKYVDNLKYYLHKTAYHGGVCGNIRMMSDGSSRGIYFSLYSLQGDGYFIKVKR